MTIALWFACPIGWFLACAQAIRILANNERGTRWTRFAAALPLFVVGFILLGCWYRFIPRVFLSS